MNIGDIQIWTEETFPRETQTVGGMIIIENKWYIISQQEIDRIQNLPNAETIVAQAEAIMQMIQQGKVEFKPTED